MASLIDKCGFVEFCKLLDVTRVPIYFYYIYVAHFYELNSLSKANQDITVCGDNQVNEREIWYIIELRIFYGFNLSGILFIAVS